MNLAKVNWQNFIPIRHGFITLTKCILLFHGHEGQDSFAGQDTKHDVACFTCCQRAAAAEHEHV